MVVISLTCGYYKHQTPGLEQKKINFLNCSADKQEVTMISIKVKLSATVVQQLIS